MPRHVAAARGGDALAPDRPWLPFTAEQWLLGSGIEFRWDARVRMAPLVTRSCRRFLRGWQRDVDGQGPRLYSGCAVVWPGNRQGRGHARLVRDSWRPFAFRETPCLTWDTVGTNKLRAAFDDGSTQAAVEFEIDGEGHVLGGGASNRPRAVGKSLVETAWSGTFGDYRLFDRIRVPATAEVTWHLREGPFTYWRGRITDFRVL